MDEKSKALDDQKTTFHLTNEFLNLTLEDLFSEPVSLNNLKEQENVDEEEDKDYSYLLDLSFEELFNIPVSMHLVEREISQHAPQSGFEPIRSSLHFDYTNLLNQEAAPILFVSHKKVIYVTDPKEDSPLTPSLEEDTTIPQPQPDPVISTNGVNRTYYTSVNETLLFIHESEATSGNLLANDNLIVGQGIINSIFGNENNSENDLNELETMIRVQTNYGDIEVNVITGDYTYTLLDASMASDQNNVVSEDIPFVYVGNDGTVYNGQLIVLVDLNQAPTGEQDRFDVIENANLIIDNPSMGLLSNDTDPDSKGSIQDLQFISAVNGISTNVGKKISLEGGGSLTVYSDGTFNFKTQGDFNDLAQNETRNVDFTYNVSDAEGLTDAVNATITVYGIQPGLNIKSMDISPYPISNILDMNDIISSSNEGVIGLSEPTPLMYYMPSTNFDLEALNYVFD